MELSGLIVYGAEESQRRSSDFDDLWLPRFEAGRFVGAKDVLGTGSRNKTQGLSCVNQPTAQGCGLMDVSTP